jgi:peptide/nickel transport system permease protein
METWQRVWSDLHDKVYPVHFFTRGFNYRLLGFIPTDIHLFGTDENEAPLLLFGTDKLGRDIFSRTIYATKVSLSIAFLGVLITLVFSIVLGGVSGYYGGIIDAIVQRISELLLSVPRLPLWMALAAAVPTNWPILKIYIVIVIFVSLLNWPWMARGIRSKLISLREEDYIYAAKSYGASNSRIIFRYLVPNFMSYVIVCITLGIPDMILFETALSFLGVGLRPPAISWGVLLYEAQNFQTVILYPWLLLPGVFVIVSILALNFVGDGVRDAADPYGTK